MSESKKIAQKIYDSLNNCRELDEIGITSLDSMVSVGYTTLPIHYFHIQKDYECNGVPACKVWKVTVELIKKRSGED